MRKKRTPIMLALAGLIASLMTFVSSGTASAAESLPEMQWAPVQAEAYRYPLTTSPMGDVTIGCGTEVSSYPQDVVTWGASGTEVRRITRTPQVDGKDNCIYRPVVDANGALYGSLTNGYLYAHSGNSLRWKYQTSCPSSSSEARPVVGVNGNIYTITNGGRLIGLTSQVETGTTQPKKILDIAVSGSRCGDALTAFKYGVMLTYDYGTKVKYLTYGGKDLGSPTEDYDGDLNFPINAEGRLFFPTWIGSGSSQSMKMSAYDPLTKEVLWTTPEAIPVAYHARSFPTPDGGVVLNIQRYKTVGGAPTTEREWALIKISGSGQKIWDISLPSTDSSGNTFANHRVSVDTTGKLVLTRRWTKQLTSSPWQVPFMTIDVLNVTTGAAVSAPKIMSGNTDQSQGTVYGYYSHVDHVVGPNTVYIPAQKCTTSCYGDGNTKIYPIKVTGLGLDYPRGAVLAMMEPQQPAAGSYVAMGDSYSAADGVEPFESGSDTSTNKCHRSEYAYSKLISRTVTTAPYLDWGKFVACSGAKTKHITGQWSATDTNNGLNLNEAPQVNALSGSTKYVSLTIGGNDMGFADYGKACVLSSAGCAIGSAAYNTALNNINNQLPSALEATYKAILDKATTADVYVLGYPQVAPIKGPNDPFDIRCGYLYDADSQGNWGDARGARDIVTKLNAKIKTKVDNVRALRAEYQRLHFVDVNASDSPFAGHTTCSDPGQSYFHNIDQALIYEGYSLHPNSRGQKAYGEALLKEMALH